MAKVLFPELPWDGRRRKMGKIFDVGQVAQLHEIQMARLRNGEPGIGREVAALIRRLTSGGVGVAGKSDDLRIIQAKRYFDLGVGEELRLASFEKYLATIPGIPPTVHLYDGLFTFLILVETRLPLKMLCALANVDFNGDDNTFQPWDARCRNPRHPVWIRLQVGYRNRGRSVDDCRSNFAKNEVGLTALEGVSAYIQHPEVVADLAQPDGHIMDLPGSVSRDYRGHAAYLRVLGAQAELVWRWSGSADPRYGSASRRVT